MHGQPLPTLFYIDHRRSTQPESGGQMLLGDVVGVPSVTDDLT
jgi:hypothetical protein